MVSIIFVTFALSNYKTMQHRVCGVSEKFCIFAGTKTNSIMSYYGNILEEELKQKVARDLFPRLDCTQIIGRVDFCVALPPDPLGLNETESLLWAEAKQGTGHPIEESFIQLIMTLGRERPQDSHLPPMFLGAFDAEKIAFLPYSAILGVLAQNDFDWTSRPSDHQTKEFQQLHQLLGDTLHSGLVTYYYERDAEELIHFIRHHFLRRSSASSQIRINKSNFVHIYQKWHAQVKPTIAINWDMAKREGIIDADFYLADILSEHNTTLGDRLFVLLRDDRYIYNMERRATGSLAFETVEFNDQQQAHSDFWRRYARPPRREYWDYIVNRRDLLVPQDVRERKGSYFTPAQWVELSQQYLAAELGEDWQEEYTIWDCCAGTGNLLAGLTNKYNIWASTLDKADVRAMHDRISNGANLLDSHVFQLDFLNDPLLDQTDSHGNTLHSKVPQPLQDIIRDPERRKKLLIYINPPYAEAGDSKQRSGTGKNKTDVAVTTDVYSRYKNKIGIAGRELFAQFIIRIYDELPTAVLAQFSTLKIVQAPNFREFRKVFRAKPGRNFLVPADTFDNVKGQFPIGFFIWHTDQKESIEGATMDVYDRKGQFLMTKTVLAYDHLKSINDWLIGTRNRRDETRLAFLSCRSHDVSHINDIYFKNDKSQVKSPRGTWITDRNLVESSIYVAVCHSIESNWLNDRDQFLYPNDDWQADLEFQSDSLVYTLFSSFNNISSEHGVNHWIPFTEEEVDAGEKFRSHFMSDFLRGRIKPRQRTDEEQQAYEADARNYHDGDIFETAATTTQVIDGTQPVQLSPAAQTVMDAGRDLWCYYHRQPDALPNASFYDIRLHFQGTKTLASGRTQMNTESRDAEYTRLIGALRQTMKALAARIRPKVYAYGFLRADSAFTSDPELFSQDDGE